MNSDKASLLGLSSLLNPSLIENERKAQELEKSIINVTQNRPNGQSVDALFAKEIDKMGASRSTLPFLAAIGAQPGQVPTVGFQAAPKVTPWPAAVPTASAAPAAAPWTMPTATPSAMPSAPPWGLTPPMMLTQPPYGGVQVSQQTNAPPVIPPAPIPQLFPQFQTPPAYATPPFVPENRGQSFVQREELKRLKERAAKIRDANYMRTTLENKKQDVSTMPVANERMSDDELDRLHATIEPYYTLIANSDSGRDLFMCVAEGMENFVDGRSVYLNKWQPSMVGWSKTASYQLNSMKRETALIAQDFIDKLGGGPLATVMVRLGSSAILHLLTESKKVAAGGDKELANDLLAVTDDP
jgi:hypothetical protein